MNKKNWYEKAKKTLVLGRSVTKFYVLILDMMDKTDAQEIQGSFGYFCLLCQKSKVRVRSNCPSVREE
jgi:hypothetical protein